MDAGWSLRPVMTGYSDGSTRVVQSGDYETMESRSKPAVQARGRSVRQSVTMPAKLAREVRRVAKQRHVTMSRAVVALIERGIEAEAAASAKLADAYERFMAESDPARKSADGEDLIRSIFGSAAVAEDPLR